MVLADQPLLAVGVSDALRSAASDCVWFGNVSGQTVANWVSKMIDLTGGPRATWAGIAGVRLLHALLILADVAMLAVVVSLALWSAAGDGVWLWDQTGKAVTN